MNQLLTFQRIGHPNILVLGDLILDRYTWGEVTRVSPEAPVLVLHATRDDNRLGGAASVAALLRGLEAEVAIAGVVGEDLPGQALRALLTAENINQDLVLCDSNRTTTNKERFLGQVASRHPHQILRVDRELCKPLAAELEQRLIQSIVANLHSYKALLISDYNKGTCTPSLLAKAIEAANSLRIPVLVDPARIADYSRYAGVTVIKPNRSEAELATGRHIVTSQDAIDAARELCERYSAASAVITLDHQGMVVYGAESREHLTAVKSREVCDITGAGDIVLATMGLALADRLPLVDAARLANSAAALEVERLGVVPVRRAELEHELDSAKRLSNEKLVTHDQIEILAAEYRRTGQTIVFTNGCFDILHAGHVSYLREASQLADILIVAINSDASVHRIKAPGRPVVSQADRATILAALQCVDHVLICDEDTPHTLLARIRPDILVKGGDYTSEQVIGREVVMEYGGKVCVAKHTPGVSTTQILSQIIKNAPE